MIFKEVESKKEWEDFILNHDYPTSFLQSWNCGEFLKKIGSKIVRLGLYDNDELKGIALINEIKAKRGNMLHLRHGPVMDFKNEKYVEAFVNQLKQMARLQKTWFIRTSALIKPQSPEEKFLKNLGFQESQMHDVDAEITWVLELDKNEEGLLADMRKTTRYSINKAKRDGVEIIKSKNPEDIEKYFWPVFVDTVKRQKWTAYSLEYIRTEFETYLEDDQTMLFLAKYQGQVIAASIFNYYKDQVVYRHSGTLSEFRNVPAAYLLQWESIQEAKERGMKKYNFWGIARTDENGELVKNHPWYGLSFFKLGFGGKVEEWMHAKDLAISPMYWFTHFFEKVERKKRGYE